MSLSLKKGDLVQVMRGEYRGKRGKILKVLPDKEKAIVEGINMVKRHMKPNTKNPQGGIVDKEATIHLSNLMLVCPKTDKPTRIGVKILENGKRVRFSKKAKESISE
ncbi:MAG: 50S ribosomal protein L24 [Chitinispirillaceae bacterium]|nr:50S ribosomal protein L24 [Chitinispirillaceae bacterium]